MSTQTERLQEAVVIVGLGYVGLPLACLAAEKGHPTYGYARDARKVGLIARGECPIHDPALAQWLRRVTIHATTDPAIIRKGDIVILCVPTPVDQAYLPNLEPLKDATEKTREHLKPGALVIVESTINPGVCEEALLPLLERDGKKVGRDFFLAHCPERINPGDPKWTVRNIPRVVGGADAESLRRAKTFYEGILEAPIHPMKSLKAAEAVKIIENAFRDVNIAFVNEIAKSFDTLGIDVLDVIEGAKTKPFSFLAHYPSCGIGGHCIPVDPYYLIKRAELSGFNHEFLKLAREINNSMPAYTVQKLLRGMNDIGKPVRGATIGLLGIAYKANIDDKRESPYFKIKRAVEELGATVASFDPYLPQDSTVRSLDELLEQSDALILVTNHDEFLRVDPKDLAAKGISVVIDGKNAWDKKAFQKAGVRYLGIGR